MWCGGILPPGGTCIPGGKWWGIGGCCEEGSPEVRGGGGGTWCPDPDDGVWYKGGGDVVGLAPNDLDGKDPTWLLGGSAAPGGRLCGGSPGWWGGYWDRWGGRWWGSIPCDRRSRSLTSLSLSLSSLFSLSLSISSVPGSFLMLKPGSFLISFCMCASEIRDGACVRAPGIGTTECDELVGVWGRNPGGSWDGATAWNAAACGGPPRGPFVSAGLSGVVCNPAGTVCPELLCFCTGANGGGCCGTPPWCGGCTTPGCAGTADCGIGCMGTGFAGEDGKAGDSMAVGDSLASPVVSSAVLSDVVEILTPVSASTTLAGDGALELALELRSSYKTKPHTYWTHIKQSLGLNKWQLSGMRSNTASQKSFRNLPQFEHHCLPNIKTHLPDYFLHLHRYCFRRFRCTRCYCPLKIQWDYQLVPEKQNYDRLETVYLPDMGFYITTVARRISPIFSFVNGGGGA